MEEVVEQSGVPRRKWRRWLRSVHLYGGLICSSYLVVYGVSSLLFSHPIDRLEREGPARERTASVKSPVAAGGDVDMARRVANELGLTGRVPGPPKWNDSTGLSFEVTRPGHRYDVRAAANGDVVIVERSMGFSAVLKGLHDARRFPDSMLLSMWWNYTHLTVIVLLFSTISGIVLWLGTRRFTGLGWTALVGGSALLLVVTGWLIV